MVLLMICGQEFETWMPRRAVPLPMVQPMISVEGYVAGVCDPMVTIARKDVVG